jgi:hypothetical protein
MIRYPAGSLSQKNVRPAKEVTSIGCRGKRSFGLRDFAILTTLGAVPAIKPKAKGHWPRGVRRTQVRDANVLIARLRKSVRQGLSRRKAAAKVGVNDRTVRRWMAKVDYPSAERAERLRALFKKLAL